MTVNKFCVEIAKREGKKKQIDIANIKETIRVVRDIFKEKGIDFYTMVKNI